MDAQGCLYNNEFSVRIFLFNDQFILEFHDTRFHIVHGAADPDLTFVEHFMQDMTAFQDRFHGAVHIDHRHIFHEITIP